MSLRLHPRTPLSATSNNATYPLLSSRLSAGADLIYQASSGRTALHTFLNTATCALIQFHSAGIRGGTLDARGRSIAHYLAWSKTSTCAHLDRVASSNVDISARDNKGKTPLHYAVQRGAPDIVERLLGSEDGVSRQPDFQGRTLLHYATESSRAAQTFNVLLASGVDIDVHAKDSCGEQRWSRRETFWG
ncbi:hypothetical protein T440DRAFT_539190 [Plenodomus tracheiphilus IPT5]|uniref:Uncharacterized protein n=1 Tax=Plenodomus tracheiphilus IPT5 TaxID=1408161 RepID=A0A6A7BLP9_9PLEO|nr:hypothetical protein T440DRAFT_539190 [Plenodomus tracheiphilus IPT5]